MERIIVMNHGQVMFDDTPKEVFRHYKELETIGLAAPQVTYLMHELKEHGLSVDTEATPVELIPAGAIFTGKVCRGRNHFTEERVTGGRR